MNTAKVGDIVAFTFENKSCRGIVEVNKHADHEGADFNTDEDGYIVKPLNNLEIFLHARYQDTGQHWVRYLRVIKQGDIFEEDLFEM